MLRRSIAFLALAFFTLAASAQETSSGAAQDASALKTDKEKTSYALGMQLGAGLHKQGLDLDPAIVGKGFADAYSGGKTLLTEEEARAVLKSAQEEYQKNQEAIRAEKAQANQKEGEAFLAANKTKEGVVTLPDGLQYKILKAGAGKKPDADDSATCNYVGTLINGTEFDNSSKHNGPATFPLKGVIKGWTEALQLMPVGSKWELYVPSQLAYGEGGAGNVIPPNSTLIFDVELLSIQDSKEPGK
jgi:FKBP-type peptidyl-prolyl cis-trans isomerase FklB